MDTTKWFIPTAERREYVDASMGARWNLATAVAINILVLGPVYFWYDHQLLVRQMLDPVRIRFSLGAHISQVVFSAVFLILFLHQRKRPFPRRWSEIIIKISLVHLILTTTVHALVGNYDSVRISVYALVVIATVGVYFEPYWFMWLMYISSGLIIVVAAGILHGDAYQSLNVQINTLVTVVGSCIVYVAWDNARYRMYLREMRLRKLNKMKDAVLRAAGHDLRVPYDQIRRLVDFLDEPDERFMQQRKRIRDQLDRLFRRAALVIDNIVAMNISDETSFNCNNEIVSLQGLVHEVILAVDSEAREKYITIENRLDEDVLIHGDSRMLRVVFLNLLNNALKFSYPETAISVVGEIGRDSVDITIVDRGIGMDEVVRRRLLSGDLGFSTHGTAGEDGSGIGLSVCRTFLSCHGSDLSIISESGEGTTVSFSLPRYRREGVG